MIRLSTNKDYIEFVVEQLSGYTNVRYKKMFGEYMVYVDDKPLFLVCDNTVYVKKLDEIKSFFQPNEVGFPYVGAKEHYILDIENKALTLEVSRQLARLIDVAKPKKKKVMSNQTGEVLAYIENLDEENQVIMKHLRDRLKQVFPDALERLHYGVPSLFDEKPFFYYAAFKKHISIFPPLPQDHPLSDKIAPYKNDKGNLLFLKKNTIPYDLIVEVALALKDEYTN